jgi:hypothetical protein
MIGWWILRPGLELANLSLRVLTAAIAHAQGPSIAGVCPVCGAPVQSTEPFVRYRGTAFHAQPCAEDNPPAESAAAARRLA